MGPELGARIDWFEDKVVKFRNKLAHRLVMKHDEDDVFYLTTITRKPFKDIGRMEQVGLEPERRSGLYFFEYGLWLNFFSDDLIVMLQSHSEELELVNPCSPASKEEIDRFLRQAEMAKRRKHVQKPLRTLK